MVRVGTTKRRHPSPHRKDPVALQHESVLQRNRDQMQVERAELKALHHPDYEQHSTISLVVKLIFEEFVGAKKDRLRKKTQVAIDSAIRRLRDEHAARYRDKPGIRTGERIAKDCLWAAGDELFGSGRGTPTSANPSHQE